MRDLKGDLLEIKGLLKEKKKTCNLLRGAQDRRKVAGNRLGKCSLLPPSSALAPLSKSKRQDNMNIYDTIITQSDLDDFDEQIELTTKEKEILNPKNNNKGDTINGQDPTTTGGKMNTGDSTSNYHRELITDGVSLLVNIYYYLMYWIQNSKRAKVVFLIHT